MENNSNEMKANLLNWDDNRALQQAKKIIFEGGIIAYPTDTLYGFGVDATNENSINQLNKLKNRKGPISVIAPDKNVVSTWIDIPANEKDKALENLTPHRTIIYPVRKEVVNSLILGPNCTLGIRIPAHPFCISLAKQCNVPITTTSVNRKGEFPKSNTNEILESFGNSIDLIIDDGKLSGPASSIYKYQSGSLNKLR
jgi:tRNA threonylcarbamoyl adenosine modification protein (Sua5/YciO/YrdC/YwlC family)